MICLFVDDQFDISPFTYSLLNLSSKAIAHSERRLFTGFITAAFTAWKLTVNKAMVKVPAPAKPNIHQLIAVGYAKPLSHIFMAYQASGNAIIEAIITSFKKSFDS